MLENISLIILNYNSYKDTCICVDQLISFGAQLHIIIVDNLSSDGSYDKLKRRYQNINIDVILSNKNGGYSAGNNIGMKFAIEKYKSEFIGILNPDVLIPDISVIKKIMDALISNKKYVVAGGMIIDKEGSILPNKSAWNIPSKKNIVLNHFILSKRNKKSPYNMVSNNIAEVDCVAGCFFLAKSDFMKKIGFLDEGVFLYNEENLLGIKVKREGFCEIVVTDQYYYHNHHKINNTNMNFKKKVNATHKSYLSRQYLCKKYYPKVLLFFLLIIEMINKLYLSLCYLKIIIKMNREE